MPRRLIAVQHTMLGTFGKVANASEPLAVAGLFGGLPPLAQADAVLYNGWLDVGSVLF